MQGTKASLNLSLHVISEMQSLSKSEFIPSPRTKIQSHARSYWLQLISKILSIKTTPYSKTIFILLHCVECTIHRKIFYQICDYFNAHLENQAKYDPPSFFGNFSVQHPTPSEFPVCSMGGYGYFLELYIVRTSCSKCCTIKYWSDYYDNYFTVINQQQFNWLISTN